MTLSTTKIYRYDPDTLEYLPAPQSVFARIDPKQHRDNLLSVLENSADDAPAPPILIPANCQKTAPPTTKEGYAIVAVLDSNGQPTGWMYKDDYRHQVIYNTADEMQSKTVTVLGPVPDGWTLKKPDAYSKWDKKSQAWVVDTKAKTAALSSLIRAQRDALLTSTDWRVVRALELGQSLSDEWKAYRESLRNVPEQSGFPTTITWPTPPTSTDSDSSSTETGQSTATSAS
ncbi:MAG: hypothetical protein CENE_02669 [Candidatus Celerinatantimonas neptuna]|nr:MAG: hypothetical protein CENE_02669 [Candidatus Celerinatantimonas neptuna]